jgi:GntR family transcriptional regulator
MESTGPLWSRVLEDLERRLAVGEFDTAFPTDRELVDEYGVSRHTIREAVRRLQDQGLVERIPGRGSRRVGGAWEQPLGTIYSLYQSVEERGSAQTSTVLACETTTDEGAAAVLETGGPFFFLERIRHADTVPIAYDRAWIPLAVARPLLDVDFSRTSLYRELAERAGIIPEAGKETIRPLLVDAAISHHLGIPEGQAAFEVDRRTTSGGRPLEWRLTILPGELMRLRVEWKHPWEATGAEIVEA